MVAKLPLPVIASGMDPFALTIAHRAGHKDYPGHLSRDPAGNEVNYIRSHLQQILASSYCGPNTRWDSVDSFIRTELLQETNGQQLARFAQILVWEWVIRRVRDAPFSVNG